MQGVVDTIENCEKMHNHYHPEHHFCVKYKNQVSCEVSWNSGLFLFMKLHFQIHHEKFPINSFKNFQDYVGGPVLWKDPNTGLLKLVGITSFESNCYESKSSTQALNVKSFLRWIEHILRKKFLMISVLNMSFLYFQRTLKHHFANLNKSYNSIFPPPS